MEPAALDVIPAGRLFGASDITWFQTRGERELDDALGEIDLIITGPHASAAFPEEIVPFVDPTFTKRLQYDFTDVSTSPIARRWARIDGGVLYIENPHPRAVRDANRPRPADLIGNLREAFGRLADPDTRPSLSGVDAVRPVTFGYLPVLRRPSNDTEWDMLGSALATAGALGVDRYEQIRDELIERVIEAKLRRLASLDPKASARAEWDSAHTLDVLSIHDTMNHTARADGAICLERPVEDRLPNVVALSNRGDSEGEIMIDPDATMRSVVGVPTMRPARVREIGEAYRVSFAAYGGDEVAYNRPYLGGHETQLVGPLLRQLEPLAVVRCDDEPARAMRFGAWQNEFLREFLLGPESTAHLMQPGIDWSGPPAVHVEWLADRLKAAHDLVRCGNTAGANP